MRSILTSIALASGCFLQACDGTQSANETAAGETSTWDTNLSVAGQPKGKALTGCETKKRLSLEDFQETLTTLMWARCNYADGRRGVTIEYTGEIDAYFDRLVAAAAKNAELEAGESFWTILDISSPGGDVTAALTAARRMSVGKWQVAVREGKECNSACVLIYAAGTKRTRFPGAKLGVHRIFPQQSQAKSVTELDDELADVTEQARQLLRQNGVSQGLIDLMATVPSNRIHYLSIDELVQFGLGGDNSAAADVQRINVERKCGAKFQQDLADSETWGMSCVRGAPFPASESTLREGRQCMVDLATERGLLNPDCREEFCDELSGLCEPFGPVKRDPTEQ